MTLQTFPVFKRTLKAAPYEIFQHTLAALLVRQDRCDEARPIFAEIAPPDAFGLLFRRERTAARQMLRPGTMPEAKNEGATRSRGRNALQSPG